jgi:hypothetical protein
MNRTHFISVNSIKKVANLKLQIKLIVLCNIHTIYLVGTSGGTVKTNYVLYWHIVMQCVSTSSITQKALQFMITAYTL